MSEPDRVMLDIETLGLEPGSAILSIGAVRFTPAGLGERFTASISLESCEAAGLDIDAGTLQWWLEQDEAAQDVLSGGMPLSSALEEFAGWCYDADEIWANSPKFDCAHLETAAEAVDVELPWEFFELRDFRTLSELPGAEDRQQLGTEHDALDDAIYQARIASETLATLQERDAE